MRMGAILRNSAATTLVVMFSICGRYSVKAADRVDKPKLSPDVEAALASISTNGLVEHTRILSSDPFEGRAPGTPGEDRTIEYLVQQFKTLGLQPGNPDGTYIQSVPLAGFTSSSTIALTAGGKPLDLAVPKDCVAWSRRLTSKVSVKDSDMVFVGYGIVAPEYQWDDYKGV